MARSLADHTHDGSASHAHDGSPSHVHDASTPHVHNGSAPHVHYAARRHPEAVVLDLGGEIGALILYTDASMVGVEVEISAAGEDERRSHKEVLEREISGRPAYTAVFDNVRAGRYTLWVEGVAREREVLVSGGAVAELDWREHAAPGR